MGMTATPVRRFVLALAACAALALPAAAFAGMPSGGGDATAGSDPQAKGESRQQAREEKAPGRNPRGGTPEGKAGGKDREEDEDVPVFTNEDLERLFGPPPPEPRRRAGTEPAGGPRRKAGEGWGERPEAAEAPDPLKQLEAELAREEERKKRIQELQKEIARLEARLKELEDRKLRIENPFLPRPVLSPEEMETWKKLDNVGRLRLTEKQIEETRRRLDELKRELERLRRGAPAA